MPCGLPGDVKLAIKAVHQTYKSGIWSRASRIYPIYKLSFTVIFEISLYIATENENEELGRTS